MQPVLLREKYKRFKHWYKSCFITFEMFTPPTLYISAQWNQDFLGSQPGENEIISFPAETKICSKFPLWRLVQMCLSLYLYRLHIGSHTESTYRVHKNVWGECELSLFTYRAKWKYG